MKKYIIDFNSYTAVGDGNEGKWEADEQNARLSDALCMKGINTEPSYTEKIDSLSNDYELYATAEADDFDKLKAALTELAEDENNAFAILNETHDKLFSTEQA